jgi:hypothetical protein
VAAIEEAFAHGGQRILQQQPKVLALEGAEGRLHHGADPEHPSHIAAQVLAARLHRVGGQAGAVQGQENEQPKLLAGLLDQPEPARSAWRTRIAGTMQGYQAIGG